MTTYTKFQVSGVEIEVDTSNVTKSLGEVNSSSRFSATINNYKGQFTGSYNIGDEVKIFSGSINPPTNQIFLGILENINLTGKDVSERMVLSGRDYSARLIDRTVEPSAYNNLPAGSIVNDIIGQFTDDITTANVSSGLNVDRIVFNHIPVFDAIRQLADFSDFIFYIDENKDLHFKSKSTTSSGYTFGSGNIVKTNFKQKRDNVYNEIWVYGDRYLDGFQETFTGNAGSTYTLSYGPHNTSITNSGTSIGLEPIQPGGIFEMTFSTGSQFKYLVNFNDKQIILTSGTLAGDNRYIGSKIVVDYMRDLPIVKLGDDDTSIGKYGRRVKVIQDKSIKDPITAETILLRELDEFSDPLKQGTLDVKDVFDINIGETCVVDIPIYDINNVTYDILEARYNLTRKNMLADETLSLKVNRRGEDITDTIKGLLLEQRKLQSSDMQTTDLLTRYKTSTGSFGIRHSGIEIRESTVTGSQFHLYATGFVPPINPFHLASGTDQGTLAGSYTGSASAFGPFIITFSGGYF